MGLALALAAKNGKIDLKLSQGLRSTTGTSVLYAPRAMP